MRNPERILSSLAEHSKKNEYRYHRIYRILYNPEMFLRAYEKIYPNNGSMTAGTDGMTIDGMSLKRIDNIIEALKSEKYQPHPAQRTYIPKKSGGKRPLGIPSADDKLVQEVIRMILEAIYEGQFENTSHGFRPNRSCHTALNQVQKQFTGVRWFVEGDIHGFFDNINHDILVNILAERIKDDKFLRLIRKFLKAGYLENWVYHRTYSGTPQGGIISPILANIYLDRLDKYMVNLANSFNRGQKRKQNPEYHKIRLRKDRLRQKMMKSTDLQFREWAKGQLAEYDKHLYNMHFGDQFDQEYRRLFYVRYADDFLIGVIGSKEDCLVIKEQVKDYLSDVLQLELSDEKTLITHSQSPAKFLGYEITIRKCGIPKTDKNGVKKRYFTERVTLKVNSDRIRDKLLSINAMSIVVRDGKTVWKPRKITTLLHNDDLEILDYYNALLRGFYNYYSLAINCSIINSMKYILEYSMYKTYAAKYRTTVHKIIQKYRIGKDFGIRYETVKGTQTRLFYNKGFCRNKNIANGTCDMLPIIRHQNPHSLVQRLKAGICAICGAEGVPMEIHHVHKLKDLKGKAWWEQIMIGRRRKTLPLCSECHAKLHAGKLD